MLLTTRERLPLDRFPIPAYELVSFDYYFIGSIQFSSGCPYTCEFCDIPGLYGRVPRLKRPEQIIAELDKLRACGLSSLVYFVDDNFIANRRAVRELIPHLIAWQERNSFPLMFTCEATLNIAKYEDLLADLRAAYFTGIFCGVETPEPEALRQMSKQQNMMLPMLTAVERLNAFGLEVIAGMIVGLDTDTAATEASIIAFIEQSQIPMLTLNLLQALPRTPLWDRLKRDNRISEEEGRESNVVFKMPYEQTVAHLARMPRACLRSAAAVRALRLPVAPHLAEPAAASARPAHRQEPQARPRHAGQGLLEARGRRRLPADFWAFAWPRLKTGPHRRGDRHRDHRQAPDHLFPQGLRRRTQRVALFKQAAVARIASPLPVCAGMPKRGMPGWAMPVADRTAIGGNALRSAARSHRAGRETCRRAATAATARARASRTGNRTRSTARR